MCPTVFSDLHLECGHIVEIKPAKKSPFCLFGEHCQEVGYANKIQRRHPGKCPHCTETAATTKGLLKISWAQPRVPHYVQDKERCIATGLAETKKFMSNDKLTDRNCKDFLYYVLGLPSWMKKGRLVSEFGYGVQGYYGDKWEKEMTVLASRKRFDNALAAGIAKKQAETAAGQKELKNSD
ncbi:hypothetical protein MGN70_003010 [Eutypa lata]|nr:hypothetical protein MGN70_003010 [Eutypa lata]